MLPSFIIIGAQKSASTFIQRCLEEHSEIYMPDGEIPFFETPDYEESKGRLSFLEDLYDDRSESSSYGIKRPTYLCRQEVPERIANDLPDAKLIVVLRDPIVRATSSYYHNIKYGFIPPLHIEDGMRKILRDRLFLEKYPRASEVLTFGLYAACLDRYLKYFKKEQIMILFHEDILNDPLGSVKDTCTFLGVDSSYKPRALNTRPQAVVYNINRLKFLRLRNNLAFKYKHGNTRLSQKKMNIVSKLLYSTISGLDKYVASRVFGNEKPVISAFLRKTLDDYYRDDINRLETLVGRNLSEWRNS